MRFSSRSGSHEHPSPEDVEAWSRRRSVPENEAPAGLDFSVVLGRSDDTAICVTGFRVYSTGLAFTLSVRLRRELDHARVRDFYDLLSHGHGPAGGRDAGDRLLLGLEYADGRTATNLNPDRGPRVGAGDAESFIPTLVTGGGGGGGRSYDQDWWLTPLPPAGPLRFICRWPGFGIAESQTVLDGTKITEALARVQTLWPWQPTEPEPDFESVEPEVPADGWFAQALGRRLDG